MSILRTLLLLFFLSSIATAQTTLQLGTPIERELGPGNAHEFSLNLEEGQFIQVIVEQRGIDVIVRVFAPSGKSLGQYDTPNGGEGPEHVSFVAVVAGKYRITVGPLEPNAPTTGNYQIKILEIRQATEQELKTSKNVDVTKARGVALLTEIEGLIPQIKSPQTRIRAQLQAAELLWDVDEKRAARFLADASTGLKEFFASDANDISHDSPVSHLRYEVVNAVAKRDPDAALSLLQATSKILSLTADEREHFRHESQIELAIAEQAIHNNPNRALQIARQSLKRGYSPNLLQTLSQLRRQNPELGAELGNEILAKLLNEKFLKNPEAANLATTLLEIANTPASGESNGGAASFWAHDKFRELLRKVLDETLAFSNTDQPIYDMTKDMTLQLLAALQSQAAQLETLVPGSTAAVEKKMADLNNETASPARQIPDALRIFSSEDAGSEELSLETIKKLPDGVREQMYLHFANTEANKGDMARAREIINEHIKNPYQRREALRSLEQQEITRAINTGKVEEGLKGLSGFRTPRERARELAQIASQIGPGRKRAEALSLLEQARSMLSSSPQAPDQEHMAALLEIARAFARYDVKRAFEIVDPLVEQFIEISAAARMLNGFGVEFYSGEEIDLHNGNALAGLTEQFSTALGTLAVISFDRAKATTDRIKPPEVRLKIYLDIAQHTIQAAK